MENSRIPQNFEEVVLLVSSVAGEKSDAFRFRSSARGLLFRSGSFKGGFFIPNVVGFSIALLWGGAFLFAVLELSGPLEGGGSPFVPFFISLSGNFINWMLY